MVTAPAFQEYLAALRAGDRRRALRISQAALDSGVTIYDLYLKVFQPAMYEIGRLWEVGELTVAQEHLATAITHGVMAQLYPPGLARRAPELRVVATCVGGELHDLGIRMVADCFEIAGWNVCYLGANMPPQDIVGVVNERGADLLAISATLGAHVLRVRDLIGAVRASPAGPSLTILVGGQPFNRSPQIYRQIGADLCAADAYEAVIQAEARLRLGRLHEENVDV